MMNIRADRFVLLVVIINLLLVALIDPLREFGGNTDETKPEPTPFIDYDDNGETVIMPNAEFAIRSLRKSDLLTSVVVALGYEPNAIVKELSK